MLLLRRPLQCTADRGLLIFSLVAAYVDLGSDVGAAVTFYLGDEDVVVGVDGIYDVGCGRWRCHCRAASSFRDASQHDRLISLLLFHVGVFRLRARSGSDVLSFILAIAFIVVPTSVMVATTMSAARGRDRRKKVLLTVLQVGHLMYG